MKTAIFTTILSILAVNVNGFMNGLGFLFKQEKPIFKTFKYEGDLPPVDYFNPLMLGSLATESEIKFLREAELQHGRVAMCASLALPLIDLFDKQNLAIDKLSSVPLIEQTPFWFGVLAYECARMGSGWKNPFVNQSNMFKLEDDYQPGNVFKVTQELYPTVKLNRELSHGRLAMLVAAGYMAHELVTHTSVL